MSDVDTHDEGVEPEQAEAEKAQDQDDEGIVLTVPDEKADEAEGNEAAQDPHPDHA